MTDDTLNYDEATVQRPVGTLKRLHLHDRGGAKVLHTEQNGWV